MSKTTLQIQGPLMVISSDGEPSPSEMEAWRRQVVAHEMVMKEAIEEGAAAHAEAAKLVAPEPPEARPWEVYFKCSDVKAVVKMGGKIQITTGNDQHVIDGDDAVILRDIIKAWRKSLKEPNPIIGGSHKD